MVECQNADFNSPGPEVVKLFSCSTQLSIKFKLLLNTEIIKIGRKLRLRLAKPANIGIKHDFPFINIR